MNFKDTKTDRIINLDEIKEHYILTKNKGNTRYISFQEYLMDCIHKYKIIEII